MKHLVRKIRTKETVVGVIGLGYAGLPVVQAFTRAGFSVMGFAVDPAKVGKLNAGKSYIRNISARGGHHEEASFDHWGHGPGWRLSGEVPGQQGLRGARH